MATSPRPWWSSASWLGVVFVVGTVGGFLLNVLAPLASQEKISKQDRELSARIAAANNHLNSLDRRVEVTRLLFDHYFGKQASEQKAALTYLRYQFPEDLGDKRLQAILVVEAKEPAVRRQIASSVASIHRVGTRGLNSAVALERAGLQALIAEDLPRAQRLFRQAYADFPTYHNVDEISRRVLTDARVRGYHQATEQSARDRIAAGVLSEVLSSYSWGIPPDLRSRMQHRLDALS
jgi:hypothetical protein